MVSGCVAVATAHYRPIAQEDDMRPETYELDVSNYPFTVELETRYGDTDTLGHVNNVAIARLFEESRVKFGMHSRRRRFRELPQPGSVVAASVLINYLAEVFYPDPVTVAVGVGRIGTASHTLVALMLQHDRPVAHCRTTLVQFAEGQSATIPEEVRGILKNFRLRHPGNQN